MLKLWFDHDRSNTIGITTVYVFVWFTRDTFIRYSL